MPDYGTNYDTSWGEKIGAALDPMLAQERNNKLYQQAQEQSVRDMQIQRAVIDNQRADTKYQREAAAEIARNEALAKNPRMQQLIASGIPADKAWEHIQNEDNTNALMKAISPQPEPRPYQNAVDANGYPKYTIEPVGNPTSNNLNYSPAPVVDTPFKQGLSQNNNFSPVPRITRDQNAEGILRDYPNMPEGAEKQQVREALLAGGYVQPDMVQPTQAQKNAAAIRYALSGGKDVKEIAGLINPVAKELPISDIGKLIAERNRLAQISPNSQDLPIYDAAIKKHSEPTNTIDATDPNLTMSDAAIELAAHRYVTDGTLPPMGMGKNGTIGRAAILNKAADISYTNGALETNQRVDQMANKATASALAQLEKQAIQVSAFERNAKMGLNLALSLSEKVDRTGSPIVNSWIQAGQKNVSGNVELSRFHTANETFLTEYAKIMSGSMGNTPLSDAARSHAQSLLSTVQNKEQYIGVMQTLNTELDQRMKGINDERVATLQRLRHQDNSSATVSHPSNPSVQIKGKW